MPFWNKLSPQKVLNSDEIDTAWPHIVFRIPSLLMILLVILKSSKFGCISNIQDLALDTQPGSFEGEPYTS